MMNLEDSKIINPVENLVTDLIEETVSIHKKITWGNISYSLYAEYFEIANYQLSKLDTAINLAQQNLYPEAFTILRSSIESMLLFDLLSRGKKYFLLFKKYKKETDKHAISRLNKEIENAKKRGKKTSALKASGYSHLDGVVKVVYEGPYVNGRKGKGNFVPYYLNLYKQFDPKSAFLDDRNYFQYVHQRLSQKVDSKNKKINKYLYQHYLSYTGLLHALSVNRLYTIKELNRVKAHYNFLSEFIHPTETSIKIVRVRNEEKAYLNSLSEIREAYPSLRLLACVYSGYISARLAENLCFILNNSPKKYIQDFAENKLDELINDFYERTSYFWFIKNEPHAYDKFYHCIHYENPEAVDGASYKNFASNSVRFRSDILKRFLELQLGWSHQAWGTYKPPFSLSN